MTELSGHMSAAAYRTYLEQAGRGHKYHVAPPERRRYNGILYHSAREAQVAFDLDVRLQSRLIHDWTRQLDFPLVINERKVGTYRADFLVLHTDDTRELIEVKGYFTPPAKFKWKVFLALYQQEWESKGWKITLDTGE